MTEQKNLTIDKSKAVCITGHRRLFKPIDIKRLKRAFNICIDEGYDTFLIGMALGFDTLCFKVLEEIRREKEFKIIACIPCPEQNKFFSDEQKREYNRMIEVADQKIVLSPGYTSYCMMKRNRFMVDNSSVVIAYLTQDKGGTKATVDYAVKKGLQVIVFPNE